MDKACNDFLDELAIALDKAWSSDQINRISILDIPSLIYLKQSVPLRGDFSLLLSNWFLEALYNFNKKEAPYNGYAFILKEVLNNANLLLRELEPADIKAISIKAARIIDMEVRKRLNKKREYIDEETRRYLLSLSDQPRCWICGFEFPSKSIDYFLYNSKELPETLAFVDMLMPRGMKQKDMKIEVEHIIPFSRGGQDDFDNLNLSCGWCNEKKSNYLYMFEAGLGRKTLNHPYFGNILLPNYFWIVRLLGLIGKCEFDGCTNTSSTSELRVYPRNINGGLNPINLSITCKEHDLMGSKRLIRKELLS